MKDHLINGMVGNAISIDAKFSHQYISGSQYERRYLQQIISKSQHLEWECIWGSE